VQYLIPGIFERKIRRGILHTRSPELRALLGALRAYWDQPSARGIQEVSQRLDTWQREHPKEFKARGRPIYGAMIAELQEEYSRWGLRSLGTDLDAAIPFLVSTHTGKTIAPNQISPTYFYHATNYNNLRKIQINGLDPRRGGRGGASDQVNSARFKKRSAGKVHASGATHTAACYSLLHDEPPLFVKAYGKGLFKGGKVPKRPNELGKMGVILRFPKRVIPSAELEPDPDDPRDAYRIYCRIRPSRIQVLTTEGWVAIGHLKELDLALGN